MLNNIYRKEIALKVSTMKVKAKVWFEGRFQLLLKKKQQWYGEKGEKKGK